jgi:glycosyltransferase involved in cell wall biosynthesis
LNELGAGAHLHQVDNGVDIDRFPFATGDRRPFDLVFVGNLGYFPNVDAMSWFITMVLPRLVVKFPSIRLNLVGARPARSLKRFAEHVPQVQLVGVVPDVHPHFASATLAIAPLRAGSGQQLKVLEAMASGTPVVVSGVTARGLAAVDGQDLLVADGVEATVNAISRLLNDPDLRRELAINARKLVERQYTWGRSGTKLERVWQLTARAAIG